MQIRQGTMLGSQNRSDSYRLSPYLKHFNTRGNFQCRQEVCKAYHFTIWELYQLEFWEQVANRAVEDTYVTFGLGICVMQELSLSA